ncbi:MAG: HNH endonuclease [Deltaproteobacteria bacterium]|nr:HNH endonuclease [Deltaproteobacteria bacterium]
MIPLRRPPAAALSPETIAALEARAQAVAAAGTSAVPEWKAFTRSPAYRELRDTLAAGAHHKCAYCESRAPKPQLDHVQPKLTHPELAFAWDNLLPACADCNSAKGTQGGHGPDGTPRLIDPSAEDPGASLVWDTRGFVSPRDLPDDQAHARAADTIAALDLIRQDLRDGQRIARNEALYALVEAEAAAAALRAATPADRPAAEHALVKARAALLTALDLARPHRALLRQWLRAPLVAAKLAALSPDVPLLSALLDRWAALDTMHPTR